jgi:hypothetical protein
MWGQHTYIQTPPTIAEKDFCSLHMTRPIAFAQEPGNRPSAKIAITFVRENKLKKKRHIPWCAFASRAFHLVAAKNTRKRPFPPSRTPFIKERRNLFYTT